MAILSVKFLLYAVALLGGLVATFVGAMALAGDPQPTLVAIGLGAAGASSLCLWLAWRRDRVTFMRFVAVMSLIVGMVALMVLIEWDRIVVGAALILSVAAVLGAIAGLWLLRYYRAEDPVPDLLRELFDESAILERLDVQIVLYVSSREVAPLGTLEARIYLQNCCRGPRRIKAGLSPKRARLWSGGGPLRVPPPESWELGAAEVGYLSIPVQAVEDAEGSFDLWLELSVGGSRGERIRKRRARELSLRWPWWFRLIGLLGGHLLFGGGARARIRVAPDASPGEADPTEGSRWHRLYWLDEDAGSRVEPR
ncbi:MAG: hypothetical protein JRI23_03550 [Deltaproteobacteria bacterium]|jgi:uncharacterized membrane protein YqjE|nr:hypothetical protein [Deltaproteobacteria bacterium]MBW2530591.1 hypothetical protein [Deltaproteobacteria bacterium]